MDLVVNGQLSQPEALAGWYRIDNLEEERVGLDMLQHPAAVVRDLALARRICAQLTAYDRLLEACKNAENALRILALHPKGVAIEDVREDLCTAITKAEGQN